MAPKRKGVTWTSYSLVALRSVLLVVIPNFVMIFHGFIKCLNSNNQVEVFIFYFFLLILHTQIFRGKGHQVSGQE